MKIAVIGASSGTGAEVVKQALAQGHQVKAFSRNPQRLGIEDPKLEYVAGDALKLPDIRLAIQDTDAVICTLGAPPKDKNKLRTRGTQNLLKAMENQGPHRLICLSTLGFGDSLPMTPFYIKRIIIPLFLKPAFEDHETQEAAIKKSPLNWTIVRPPNLTEGPATGTYLYGFRFDNKAVKMKKISRADVAGFMLRQLDDQSFLRKTVGISN